jgi:DNA-binding MarR family transcriptional regulator
VPDRLPLSTLLSQVLVAQTIELDNEFERRLAESGESARVTSVVMWSNFLRFVGDGIAVGELPDAAGLPKARMLSTLGGMERWRYVFVAPANAGGPPKAKRDGHGSARGLHPDWLVRPTPAGRVTQEIRPALFDEVDVRWTERFGSGCVGDLRGSLEAIVGRLDVDLPEYVPIVAGTDGMVAGFTPRPRADAATPSQLTTLLARALLAYTLDFEAEYELSLALGANFVRVLGEAETAVRDIPALAGVSKEATAMALGYLAKAGHVVREGSTAATTRVRLTSTGRTAQARLPAVHAQIAAAWDERFGPAAVERLGTSLEAVLEHASLNEGLRPPPDGWRASKPYCACTDALLEDPRATLPHYPLVLHRGGWPDGS